MTDLNEDKDPYILTPEEGAAAILNAIESAKAHYQWKQMNKGMRVFDYETKMATQDWESKINRIDILMTANSNKHRYLSHEESILKARNEEIENRKDLEIRCDAKYMFNVMAAFSRNYFNKQLIVSEANKFLITALCYFLSKDLRFETDLGFNFKKGLWIRGATGRGKTYLTKCISQNELRPVTILNLIDITESLKTDDDYQLPHFKTLFLDDVGTEELDSKRYGSTISFFKNFIELQSIHHTDFSHLMVSTNCSFNDIKERYGFRVNSRVKEMFNIIDIDGVDLRG